VKSDVAGLYTNVKKKTVINTSFTKTCHNDNQPRNVVCIKCTVPQTLDSVQHNFILKSNYSPCHIQERIYLPPE